MKGSSQGNRISARYVAGEVEATTRRRRHSRTPPDRRPPGSPPRRPTLVNTKPAKPPASGMGFWLATVLLASLGSVGWLHHTSTRATAALEQQIGQLARTYGETQMELRSLSQLSHRVGMLFDQVRSERNSTREIRQQIQALARRLPEETNLPRLSSRVRQMELQFMQVEQQLADGIDQEALQQIEKMVGDLHQRITTVNAQTSRLIHHLANSEEGGWSEPFQLALAGRGGVEEVGGWSVVLPPIADRLEAEQRARTLALDDLEVTSELGVKQYHLRIDGFRDLEHAREFLLGNPENPALKGAWLSKSPR